MVFNIGGFTIDVQEGFSTTQLQYKSTVVVAFPAEGDEQSVVRVHDDAIALVKARGQRKLYVIYDDFHAEPDVIRHIEFDYETLGNAGWDIIVSRGRELRPNRNVWTTIDYAASKLVALHPRIIEIAVGFLTIWTLLHRHI